MNAPDGIRIDAQLLQLYHAIGVAQPAVIREWTAKTLRIEEIDFENFNSARWHERPRPDVVHIMRRYLYAVRTDAPQSFATA